MRENLKNVRKISALQMEILMEAHERELMNQEPITSYNTISSKGLISRGLLEARLCYTVNGKVLSFFITEKGKLFLEEKL